MECGLLYPVQSERVTIKISETNRLRKEGVAAGAFVTRDFFPKVAMGLFISHARRSCVLSL